LNVPATWYHVFGEMVVLKSSAPVPMLASSHLKWNLFPLPDLNRPYQLAPHLSCSRITLHPPGIEPGMYTHAVSVMLVTPSPEAAPTWT
jgi:hypothetical protein